VKYFRIGISFIFLFSLLVTGMIEPKNFVYCTVVLTMILIHFQVEDIKGRV